MCGLSSNEDLEGEDHHECSLREIRKGEKAVLRVIAAFEGFLIPFKIPDKDSLYVISSGCRVPPAVECDVLRAEAVGKQEKETFIQDRLSPDSTKGFFDRLKKVKLLTMEQNNKKAKLTTSEGRVVQYREQGDIAFQLLVKSQLLEEPLSIDDIMCYCLTPVPHSIGTPDGFMAKTDKAKLMAKITSGFQCAAPTANDDGTLFIYDGNAQVHALVDVPNTFEAICLKLLDQLHRSADIIFSTDTYQPTSVKSQERLRRGCGEKILVQGIKTRRPADFKQFLLNPDNKLQLLDLLLRVWSSHTASQRVHKRKVMVAVQNKVICITSDDGSRSQESEIHSLRSDQEETDTRVVLYARYAQNHGYQRVVIRSPDSDIFHILLYYAHSIDIPIIFDTGTGARRKLWNITEIAQDLGEDYCETLLGLHVFTGEDTNCAFKGKGKITPLKKMQSKPWYQSALRKLGKGWNVKPSVFKELEEFICFLYGYGRIRKVNEVRAAMLRKMVGEGEQLNPKSKVDLRFRQQLDMDG